MIPFTSPLAPFLDPGSLAYEHPERFGYRRYADSLQDHRKLLLQPSWKHILSYETRWLDRHTLANVTYEAGLRLNRLKREVGLTSDEKAQETEMRIQEARSLMKEIDRVLDSYSGDDVQRVLQRLKPRIDRANTSTVCDKSELDVEVGPMPFKVINLARIGLGISE